MSIETTGFPKMDFVLAFLRLLKGVTVYPKEHPLISGSLETILKTVRGVRGEGHGLIISVNRGFLFIDGDRVEITPENYSFIRSIIQIFDDLGVGEMEFLPYDISRDRLYRFFKIIALPCSGFEDLLRKMDRDGIIGGIFVRPALQAAEGSLRSRAKKLYFQTLALVRRYFQGDRPVPLVKLKAVATYMADILQQSEETLLSLTVIKNYDDYTYNHCLNVAILSLGLALRLGMSKKFLVSLGTGALVHDIGKVTIPPEILNKPGPLTDEEWLIVRRHPVSGLAFLLRQWGINTETSRMFPSVLEHHLELNYSGYPEFLRSKSPSLLSRIVHITDFYDAVTTPRVYHKKALSPVDALDFLVNNAGKRFDPVLVKAFVYMIGVYPVGTVVKLSTGEWAMVVEKPPEAAPLDKPVVAVVASDEGKPLSPRRVNLHEEPVDVVGVSEQSPWDAGLNPTQLALALSEES